MENLKKKELLEQIGTIAKMDTDMMNAPDVKEAFSKFIDAMNRAMIWKLDLGTKALIALIKTYVDHTVDHINDDNVNDVFRYLENELEEFSDNVAMVVTLSVARIAIQKWCEAIGIDVENKLFNADDKDYLQNLIDELENYRGQDDEGIFDTLMGILTDTCKEIGVGKLEKQVAADKTDVFKGGIAVKKAFLNGDSPSVKPATSTEELSHYIKPVGSMRQMLLNICQGDYTDLMNLDVLNDVLKELIRVGTSRDISGYMRLWVIADTYRIFGTLFDVILSSESSASVLDRFTVLQYLYDTIVTVFGNDVPAPVIPWVEYCLLSIATYEYTVFNNVSDITRARMQTIIDYDHSETHNDMSVWSLYESVEDFVEKFHSGFPKSFPVPEDFWYKIFDTSRNLGFVSRDEENAESGKEKVPPLVMERVESDPTSVDPTGVISPVSTELEMPSNVGSVVDRTTEVHFKAIRAAQTTDISNIENVLGEIEGALRMVMTYRKSFPEMARLQTNLESDKILLETRVANLKNAK